MNAIQPHDLSTQAERTTITGPNEIDFAILADVVGGCGGFRRVCSGMVRAWLASVAIVRPPQFGCWG